MSVKMWRRYIAEFVGTCALVFAGTTMRAMVGGDTHDFAGVLLVHMVFGFVIVAMTYSLATISGAHFNPAITFGFALSRCFPWRYVFPYWVAQISGAIFASFLNFLLIPQQAMVAHFGATTPQIGYPQAVTVEMLLTFLLMFVSMATGTDRRANPGVVGISAGMIVILSGLAGNFLTGGSMNPARSLGPALFAGNPALSTYWIYVVGPILGATIASLLYEFLRGDRSNAKCAPEDIEAVTGTASLPSVKEEAKPVKQAV